jgi:TPR repeat protein
MNIQTGEMGLLPHANLYMVDAEDVVDNAEKEKAVLHTLAKELRDSAMYGDDVTIKKLLAMGIDPHFVDSDIENDGGDVSTFRNWFPLYEAAVYGHELCIKTLLSVDNPNVRKTLSQQDAEGWSALHAAVFHNQVSVARLLVDAGSDLNLEDAFSRNPHTLAVMWGSCAEIHLLLDPASLTLTDDEILITVDGLGKEPPTSIARSLIAMKDVYSKQVDEGKNTEAAVSAFNIAKGYTTNENSTLAFQWFEKAANLGHTEAQFELGECYSSGKGVAASQLNAVVWLHKASDQGHVKALFSLGMYLVATMKDPSEAVACIRTAAECKNPEAQYQLGTYYHDGIGVEIDHAKGNFWYCKAAAQNLTCAQLELGMRCLEGNDLDDVMPRDAAHWFREAAQLKNNKYAPQAMYQYGLCLRDGVGAEIDLNEAVNWFKNSISSTAKHSSVELVASSAAQRAIHELHKAANEGKHLGAHKFLGDTLLSGRLSRVLPQDVLEAAEWYRKLGMCYRNGPVSYEHGGAHTVLGEELDQATEWLTKAAKSGSAEALCNLQEIAEEGHVSAQYMLGLLHYDPEIKIINPQLRLHNYEAAQRWFGRAAENGHIHAADKYTLAGAKLQAANQSKAKAAVLKINNREGNALRRKMAQGHAQMARCYFAGRFDEAKSAFQHLADDAVREQFRLTEITETCRVKYESDKAKWAKIVDIDKWWREAKARSGYSVAMSPLQHTQPSSFLSVQLHGDNVPHLLSPSKAKPTLKPKPMLKPKPKVSGEHLKPRRLSKPPSCSASKSKLNFPGDNRQPATLQVEEQECIESLLLRSKWGLPEFRSRLEALEQKLNSAGKFPAILPGVDPAVFWAKLSPDMGNSMLRDKHEGKNTYLRVGTLKELVRCRQKVLEEYVNDPKGEHLERPAARYLVDTLRATYTFEDPCALAVAFELVKNMPKCKVIRVKNKLTDITLKPHLRTTILVNVEMLDLEPSGLPMICEIQFTFQDYLDIKKELHKMYEFERANGDFRKLIEPVFDKHDDADRDGASTTKRLDIVHKELVTLEEMERHYTRLLEVYHEDTMQVARAEQTKRGSLVSDSDGESEHRFASPSPCQNGGNQKKLDILNDTLMEFEDLKDALVKQALARGRASVPAGLLQRRMGSVRVVVTPRVENGSLLTTVGTLAM